jgi:hypothetical protein
MATFLRPELGVASSGVKWTSDDGNYLLWQSTDSDVVLFSPKQPTLTKGKNGKYQTNVTVYDEQVKLPDGRDTVKITGGSAVVTFTAEVEQQMVDQMQEQWRKEFLRQPGVKTQSPKFVALGLRKGKAVVDLDPQLGKVHLEHNAGSVGTSGGTMAFVFDLTEKGAQVWESGITKKTGIPGAIRLEYEYLQWVPPSGATVTMHGKRVFQHLSTALDVSVDGFWYGGSAKIEAEWEKMVRNRAIEVKFHNLDQMSPEQRKRVEDSIDAYIKASYKHWEDIIFAPKPNVQPAKPGNTGGLFGGANFALKWKKAEEAIDDTYSISFDGWTTLSFRMDAPLAMLAQLDSSYVNRVQLQRSFESRVVIDPDNQLQTVLVDWKASEGQAPKTPIFGEQGGVETYVVTSQKPNDVKISYTAKISYKPPKWPVIQTSGTGRAALIRTSQWIGSHEIFMFVRDGDRIVTPDEIDENSYIVANVSYSGAHLTQPIKDSAKISVFEPLTFEFPLSPSGARGEAKFSAFGVIDGKLVRAKDQVISPDEQAVFILASKDGIQLVSKDTVLPESDELAQRLLEAGARPLIKPATETQKSEDMVPANGNGHSKTNGRQIAGILIAVEYGSQGASLWIDADGDKKRVRLHDVREAEPFDDEGRKKVKVLLDEAGVYAESILVEL